MFANSSASHHSMFIAPEEALTPRGERGGAATSQGGAAAEPAAEPAVELGGSGSRVYSCERPGCGYTGTYASVAAHEASCGVAAAGPFDGGRSKLAAEHDARMRRIDARIAEEHGAEEHGAEEHGAEVRCVRAPRPSPPHQCRAGIAAHCVATPRDRGRRGTRSGGRTGATCS